MGGDHHALVLVLLTLLDPHDPPHPNDCASKPIADDDEGEVV